MDEEERILILWSAPRCRSTAFLKMMAQRGDFTIVHEPFSHVINFGEAKVAERTVHTETELMESLVELAERGPVFAKDTTDYHYPVLLRATGFLRRATHSFMIRDPRAAIASHYRLHPALNRDEIGFAWLHEIYAAVVSATGDHPVIIDSDDLVRAPEAVVREYCRRVGITYLPDALSWQEGMFPQWERTARWHVEASRSTGFVDSPAPPPDLDDHPVLGPYLRYHLPYYEEMYRNRLVPRTG